MSDARQGGYSNLLRQQTALARFGERALISDDLDDLLNEACRLVSDALGTELSKVMELQEDGKTLLMRAGVGWKPGMVGEVTLEAHNDSSEGHALKTGEPMISPDISKETRFKYPRFLIENGVQAVANVVIIGGHNRPPFGVLQIDSRKPRQFTEDDTAFLRSYANLLAAAVDRLRVIAEVRDGEERLRLALEGGDLGSWEVDLDSGVASHSARYDQIFGYAEPPDDWTYDIFLEHVLPEDREQVAKKFRRAVATGMECHFECRICRAGDGDIRWIEARGRPAATRGNAPPGHLLGVVADVTIRKQAEAALLRSREALESRLKAQQAQQESDARFRFATESGRLGVWELDLKTTELTTSAECRDNFGHDPAAPFSYQDMQLAVHPDDRGRMQATLDQSIATGKEYDIECRIVRGTGIHGWVQMHAQVEHAADGSASRMAGISLNTTERVLTAERVRHAERIEAVGRLTAGVAHDFNNVLQALLGALELAILEVEDKPDIAGDLELALQAGQRGARLTSHLLSFSRQQMLRPVPLALAPLLTNLCRTLERTLGRDIAVHIHIAPNLPVVLADAGHLDSALLNLALNARDAMTRGGELRMEAYAAGGQVVIAVTDTGEGMTAEVLAKACEPFFSTKGLKGSGLGLSMVEGFARQSGGELRISSLPGQGARIEISLPTASDPSVPPSAPQAPQQLRGKGRILLVDDEVAVGLVTATFLRKAGFDTTTVGDGDEALAQLTGDLRFDALVTDYALPGLSGTRLVWRARQLHPALPALIITGYGETEEMEHRPADVAILRKPFELWDLVGRINGMVNAAAGAPA